MYMPIKMIRDARKKIRLKTRGPKTFFFYILMHTQNDPSRNGPRSKRPITKRPKIKTTQAQNGPRLNTTQAQNAPSLKRPKAQNDPWHRTTQGKKQSKI
jgi:hypothetical protein